MKLVFCVADAVHHMKHMFDAVDGHFYVLFPIFRVKCLIQSSQHLISMFTGIFQCTSTLYINSGCLLGSRKIAVYVHELSARADIN